MIGKIAVLGKLTQRPRQAQTFLLAVRTFAGTRTQHHLRDHEREPSTLGVTYDHRLLEEKGTGGETIHNTPDNVFDGPANLLYSKKEEMKPSSPADEKKFQDNKPGYDARLQDYTNPHQRTQQNKKTLQGMSTGGYSDNHGLGNADVQSIIDDVDPVHPIKREPSVMDASVKANPPKAKGKLKRVSPSEGQPLGPHS
jgi:hypothetical protein